jgi:hypothetical protein
MPDMAAFTVRWLQWTAILDQSLHNGLHIQICNIATLPVFCMGVKRGLSR